jgi:plastocyanin
VSDERIRPRRGLVLRDMLRLLTYMCVLLVFPLALLACGSDDDEEASGQQVDVTGTEFAFDPSDIQLDSAGTYTFHLTNAGDMDHALEIDGQGIEEETSVIGGGESADVTVDLAEGEYEIYCPVGNHREMGMEGTLVVGGGGGAGTGTGSDTTEDDTTTDDDTGTEDDAMGY